MAELITQKELADILGVSKQYIGKLAKQGVFDSCFQGKKLDKNCALETYFLFKNSSTSAKKRSKTNFSSKSVGNDLEELLLAAQTPIQKVQIQKDYWAAKLNEFKFEVEKGKYYPKEVIDKKAEHILVSFRNKTLALPSKIAPALVGIEDAAEIKAILDNAVYELLDELSRLEDVTE